MGLGYFFDTYALVEIATANPLFSKYSSEYGEITIFNLAEIYWVTLNGHGAEYADRTFNRFKEYVVDVSDDVLKKAIAFRHKHKKQNLSYADCIGYVHALENNLKFLTGDRAFEKLANVEFVK